MAAGKRDIVVEQGATWRLGVTWMNPDGVTPIDLTGAHARMQIRRAPGDDVALVSISDVSSADGSIVIDAGTGHLSLVISPAATERLALRCAAYDLVLELANGEVYRILEGAANISRSVTEPTYTTV
jgi:hypothetical protein